MQDAAEKTLRRKSDFIKLHCWGIDCEIKSKLWQIDVIDHLANKRRGPVRDWKPQVTHHGIQKAMNWHDMCPKIDNLMSTLWFDCCENRLQMFNNWLRILRSTTMMLASLAWEPTMTTHLPSLSTYIRHRVAPSREADSTLYRSVCSSGWWRFLSGESQLWRHLLCVWMKGENCSSPGIVFKEAFSTFQVQEDSRKFSAKKGWRRRIN